MKRILICTTLLSTVRCFLVPHITLLQDMGYSVDIAGQRDVDELDGLVHRVYDIPFQRTPFSLNNIVASRRLVEIVRSNRYDAIHFHTPIASAFGRFAVRKFRRSGTIVIYTAHGFHFFRGAPLKNWLLYYPVERFLSSHTDIIITINREDHARARAFKHKGVIYVPGVGLDVNKFRSIPVDRDAKRIELGIPTNSLVLLSVGELNSNKNHETIIKAMAKLSYLNIVYIICGQGSKKMDLVKLCESYGLTSRVKLLGYRLDVAAIYKTADVFVFPSRREGLGLAALEAMAAGLPIITSNVHGIVDYSVDGVTGFTCAPGDVRGFANAIERLFHASELRESMGIHNASAVHEFELTSVLNAMKLIYDRLALI